MRIAKALFVLLVVIVLAAGFILPSLWAAEPRSHQSGSRNNEDKSRKVTPLDKIIDQVISREHNEITSFELFHPIVETYIQELKPDREMGTVPYADDYFIGQTDLAHGIGIHSMLRGHGFFAGLLPDLTANSSWDARGFLQLIYIDRNGFDRNHYDFKYAGQDFLGAVRCLMFDIAPKRPSEKGRFRGRIWVEDQNYNIIRFNGRYTRVNTLSDYALHFDSWRANVQPDLWLPVYIFAEAVNKKPGAPPKAKSQTRFWGYSAKAATGESEFSELYIDSDQQVQDDSSRGRDLSPLQEQRQFDRDAEDNVIHTLVRDGLVAPEGPVDKVLDTVLNNLEVTNHLDIEPELRCRVLLTSNIELFSIGHTIVLSRGLLDVLPDESTLAVMLAQELSDALVWKPSTSEYGFYDLLQTPASKAMKEFSFKDSHADLQSQSSMTLAILRNSPYRANLETAALFLQQLSEESKKLPHLVGAHLGNRIYPIAALMNSGPQLQPEKIDQIAALPMGSRIKLNPWNDEIEMLKDTKPALESAREKMPFEITPFMPYLTRYNDTHSATSARRRSVIGLASER